MYGIWLELCIICVMSWHWSPFNESIALFVLFVANYSICTWVLQNKRSMFRSNVSHKIGQYDKLAVWFKSSQVKCIYGRFLTQLRDKKSELVTSFGCGFYLIASENAYSSIFIWTNRQRAHSKRCCEFQNITNENIFNSKWQSNLKKINLVWKKWECSENGNVFFIQF